MERVKPIVKWVARGVAIVFLALVLAAIAILIVIPRGVHGTALTVLTGSMTPRIPVGSVVIDRPVDPGTLRVGDIATYQKAPGLNEYITHRIVAINTKTTPVTFTFKGDANRGPDINPVPATAIRGKVWFHVAYLGAIRDSLRSHGMRGIALLLAVIAFAGAAVFQLLAAVRGRRARPIGQRSLRIRCASHAFDPADPGFVARLMHGEATLADDGSATLIFTGPPQRLAVIREALEPYGTEIDESAADMPLVRPPHPRHSAELQEVPPCV